MINNTKIINDITDKMPINMVVPKVGYFHSFFKNKVSGVGRSLQGLIADIMKSSNKDVYLQELFEALHNDEIIIDKPLFVCFHSKMIISTSEQRNRIRDSIKGELCEYLLINPLKRDVYELSATEKVLFEEFKEIERIEDVIAKISEYFPLDPYEVLQKWEKDTIVRYSFVPNLNYHALIDENYDYSQQPMILHHIDKPEFKYFRIVLTEMCSLSCVYCYYSTHKEISRNIMSKNQLFKTIDYILDLSLKNGNDQVYIQWWGGDPAEEEHLLIEGTEYCKKVFSNAGIKVHFSICSSFVSNNTKEFFDYLLENDFQITVSLDGDSQTHNLHKPHVDGSNSYDEAINSYKYLRKHFPHITQLLENKEDSVVKGKIKCRCTVYKNINEYRSLCDFFDSFDQSYRICLVSDENTMENKKVFRKHLIKQIKDNQNQIIDTYLGKQSEKTISPIFCNAITNPQKGLKFIYARCGFGGGIVIINTKGKLYTCHRFCDIDDMCIGTIDDPYEDVLEKTMKLRKRWNLTFDKCNNCNLKALCSGNCAYESFIKYGDVLRTASCIDLELIKEKTVLYYLIKKLFPEYLKVNLNVEDCSCVRNLWC